MDYSLGTMVGRGTGWVTGRMGDGNVSCKMLKGKSKGIDIQRNYQKEGSLQTELISGEPK